MITRYLFKSIFLIACLLLQLNSSSSSAMSASPRPIAFPMLPSFEVLERAALRKAGISPESIKTWQKNARRTVALPRLQVGYDQKAVIQNTAVVEDSVSVTSSGVVVGPPSNRINQDFDSNHGFEVKAVWALDELLFNQNELEISREARDLYFVRNQLLQDLQQSYFELKELLLRQQLDPSIAEDPVEQLKIEQIIEKLNSLTGGEFKRLMSQQALGGAQ